MAADENRTISLMGGDDPGSGGPSPAVGQMGDAGSVCDLSPLQDFVRAKKKIDKIFVEIEDYVRDTVTCMQSAEPVGITVKCDDAVKVEGYIANVTTIRNILTRVHMKVAFVGRTSNGKSSVINAMLGEKILPSRFGHTTSCFLQLEGSDSGEPYLVKEGSTEKQNVESVGQLANALCNERMEESQLVHIYWPKEKCLLLRDEVVFVDSPGIDMSPNFDEWIDRYCLDADVFVFVANAQSTLTHAEKNFFHEVLKRVAKPNIFLLNNHWDVLASDPDNLDQVRAQHMERAVEFLVKELNVCTQSEAKQSIFFVSAKETLQARLQEEKKLPAQIVTLVDGFPKRYSDFQDFEQKFKECISKSAVRTKFEHHFQRGKLIVSEIQQIIDSTCDQAQQLKVRKAVAKKEIQDKRKFTVQQLLLLTQKMKDRIQEKVEYVQLKVYRAFSEEICRLSVLVDKFDFPFHSEHAFLYKYKREILHHVENELDSNLRASLSVELAKSIENSHQEMREQMSCLLPAEKRNALPQQERFEIFYRLKCDNICADFQEDLAFKFSLNWAESSVTDAAAGRIGESYLCGRARWKDEEKGIEFKRQFVSHVTKKQQTIFNSISGDCSKQVKQELSSTLQRLHDLVKEAINDMDAEIKTLDEEIKQLEEATNSAKVLQNKANYIAKELEEFYDAFLKLRE